MIIDDINVEVAVVLVSYGVDRTIITLLYLVHLYVLAIVLSFEQLVMLGQRIAHNLKVLILVVDDCYTLFGVISNDNLDHILLCVDVSSQSKVLEQIAVLVKLLQSLDMSLIR